MPSYWYGRPCCLDVDCLRSNIQYFCHNDDDGIGPILDWYNSTFVDNGGPCYGGAAVVKYLDLDAPPYTFLGECPYGPRWWCIRCNNFGDNNCRCRCGKLEDVQKYLSDLQRLSPCDNATIEVAKDAVCGEVNGVVPCDPQKDYYRKLWACDGKLMTIGGRLVVCKSAYTPPPPGLFTDCDACIGGKQPTTIGVDFALDPQYPSLNGWSNESVELVTCPDKWNCACYFFNDAVNGTTPPPDAPPFPATPRDITNQRGISVCLNIAYLPELNPEGTDYTGNVFYGVVPEITIHEYINRVPDVPAYIYPLVCGYYAFLQTPGPYDPAFSGFDGPEAPWGGRLTFPFTGFWWENFVPYGLALAEDLDPEAPYQFDCSGHSFDIDCEAFGYGPGSKVTIHT